MGGGVMRGWSIFPVPDSRLARIGFGHVMRLQEDAELGPRRHPFRHWANLLEDPDPNVHILMKP